MKVIENETHGSLVKPQKATYIKGDCVEHRAGQGQRGLGERGAERSGEIGENSTIITS